MQEMVMPTGLLLEIAPVLHVPCWEEKDMGLLCYISIQYTFKWGISWTAIQPFLSHD